MTAIAFRMALSALLGLLPGCATLPADLARTHGIHQAHAVQTVAIGSMSYLNATSYVIAEGAPTPAFQHRRRFAIGDGPVITLHPSARTVAAGADDEALETVASALASMTGRLGMYTGREAPARSLGVYLVHPTEQVRMHRPSFTPGRRHRIDLAVRFDPSEPEASTRRLVRTFAHEMLHVSLGVHGRAMAAGIEEERAASAIEHCLEVDVFGDTSSPGRMVTIQRGDMTAVDQSVAARYGQDEALDALFGDMPTIHSRNASPLRSLCIARARQRGS